MKNRLLLSLWVLILGLGHHAFGQNELDAFRYNNTGLVGTARAIGMGGAFSAVGADFTAASLNPAGLALYRRSDLMFTPRLRFTKTTAEYMGVSEAQSDSKFGISNFGYVGASRIERWDKNTLTRTEPEKGLKSYAFAVGVNQIANFSRFMQVSAYNEDNSITDYFASLASGASYLNLPTTYGLAGSAYDAYLIDTSGVDGQYVGAALGGNMQQDITIIETGRVNEWTIAGALNLEDKFYGGLTIGIVDLKYSQELYHDESDINNIHNTWANDSTPLASMSYTDFYDVRGTGINLKMGVILRPVDYLRFGVSFQSPSVISMNDDYIYEITGQIDQDATNYGRPEESGTFAYTLNTPFKVTLGAMGLINKKGFVTADFEYIDYTTNRFRTPASSANFYDFRDENANIRSLFASAINARVGGELRLNEFRFRLGYAMFGSVLGKEALNYIDFETQEVQKLLGTRHFVTGGFGYKHENFYLDLAFSREASADRRIYYTVSDVNAYSPELIRRTTVGNMYMTIGFTF